MKNEVCIHINIRILLLFRWEGSELKALNILVNLKGSYTTRK